MTSTTEQQGRRKPRALSKKNYKRIRDKVALLAPEITKYAASFATARLRCLGAHANRSDLRPGLENAKDIAGEVLRKWLEGARQDWDGKTDSLRQAIRGCVNSIISGGLKRKDNLLVEQVDDAAVDWLPGAMRVSNPELYALEERVNRYSQAKLLRRLFPDEGYGREADILGAMLVHRVFEVGAIADRLGLTEDEVHRDFKRMAAYMQTSEFDRRHRQLFGDRKTGPDIYEIRSLAIELFDQPIEPINQRPN